MIGDRTNNVAEVVMSYNLFNGGSDRARERQFVEKKHMAIDLRDKACRDTRQTLSIAFNDVKRLREQVSFLTIQVGLLEKTRDAYRDQFNLGQRTLLDLLDTENELLSARRSAINSDMDLALAYLRTYAGMGTLLEFLELKKLDTDEVAPEDLNTVGVADACAAVPIKAVELDRQALNARAQALLESSGRGALALPSAQPFALPAPVAPAGASVEAATGAKKEVVDQVRVWATASARKDFVTYQGLYAPSFVSAAGGTREDWSNMQRARFAKKSGQLPVDVQNLSVRPSGLDRAIAEFTQDHGDEKHPGQVRKTLVFVKAGNAWLIERETAVPVTKK